jgi:hypothetical protein
VSANQQLVILSLASVTTVRGYIYDIELLLNNPNLCLPVDFFANVTAGSWCVMYWLESKGAVDARLPWTVKEAAGALGFICADRQDAMHKCHRFFHYQGDARRSDACIAGECCARRACLTLVS